MAEIPELTDAEAAILRMPFASFADLCRLTRDGLLNDDGNDVTDLGRERLAAYDAKKRAEIEAPLRELLRRLVDFCDRGPKDPLTDSALHDASEFLRRSPT